MPTSVHRWAERVKQNDHHGGGRLFIGESGLGSLDVDKVVGSKH